MNWAAKHGSTVLLAKMLDSEAPATIASQCNFIEAAIHANQGDVIRMAGIPSQMLLKSGHNLLKTAAHCGNVAALRALLDAPWPCEPQKLFAINAGIEAGHRNVVELLIDETILDDALVLKAIFHRQFEIAEMLFRRTRIIPSEQELALAAACGLVAHVQRLMPRSGWPVACCTIPVAHDRAFSQNPYSLNALEFAAGNGVLEIADCLLQEAGSCIPGNPLAFSCYHGHFQMTKLLLSYGAVQSDTEDIWPIAIFIKDHPRLKQLVNYSISQVPNKTLPSLVYAAKGPATARFLSDQRIFDAIDKTLLINIACGNGLPHLLDVVLEKGKPDQGSIPRIIGSAAVAEKPDEAIMDVFIKHGTDINSVRGKPVLSLVIEKCGAPQSLEALLARGANPLQRYGPGAFPLFDVANGRLREEGMKALLAYLNPDPSLVEVLLECRRRAVFRGKWCMAMVLDRFIAVPAPRLINSAFMFILNWEFSGVPVGCFFVLLDRLWKPVTGCIDRYREYLLVLK